MQFLIKLNLFESQPNIDETYAAILEKGGLCSAQLISLQTASATSASGGYAKADKHLHGSYCDFGLIYDMRLPPYLKQAMVSSQHF